MTMKSPHQAATMGSRLQVPLSTGGALLISVSGAVGALGVLFLLAAVLAWLNIWRSEWSPSAVAEETSLDEVMVMLEPAPPLPPPAPPAQKESIRFLPTTALEESPTSPDLAAAKFISNRNTRAASEGEPEPEAIRGLPKQQGLDIPLVDLANREFAEGEDKEEERMDAGPGAGAPKPLPPLPNPAATSETPQPPAPSAAAPPKPKILAEANPVVDAESELTAHQQTPSGDRPKELAFREPNWEQVHPKETPVQPDRNLPKPNRAMPVESPQGGSPGAPRGKVKDALQLQAVKTKLNGAITAKGPGSVDAVETPLGRYMEKVRNSVGRVFRPACMRHSDRITYGTVQVEFDINPKGVAENLRITDGGGTNAATQDLVLNVILQSKLPAIPADLTDYLIGNRLHISYGFIFH